MKTIVLDDWGLSLEDVAAISRGEARLCLSETTVARVLRARRLVERLVAAEAPVYGVTTGFGRLADVPISAYHSRQLQLNLLRSHAAGVGPPFPADIVRAMMVLRVTALARGYSGVRPELLQLFCDMLAAGVHPVVPEQGSLGASGDLAPLAHLALVLVGEGEAEFRGRVLPGREALRAAGLRPLVLEAKEGLALINGTQAMTAVGVLALLQAETLARVADAVAALTVEVLRGIPAAYDERLHALRPHRGQRLVASNLRRLLAGSGLTTEPGELRMQDAYSLRCIPQVHGAFREALLHVRRVLSTEVNAVTDNPVLFPDAERVVSGGNFHGQAVAEALDFLTLSAANLATMIERRVERLVNPQTSGLPPFLTARPGLQSGLMLVQYTAASLASESKSLAFPASVDSIPSSAGQEDHVSMGTIAARKSRTVVRHLGLLLAAELLCACQAVEFVGEHHLAPAGAALYRAVRRLVPPFDEDRPPGPALETLAGLLSGGELLRQVESVSGRLA